MTATFGFDTTGLRARAIGGSGDVVSARVDTTTKVGRFVFTGLDADTEYAYQIEDDDSDQVLRGWTGAFRTLPSGSNVSFTFAVAGDATTDSNDPVFDAIRAKDPAFFLWLGDAHYRNLDTSSAATYRAAYDAIMAAGRPGVLFRAMPVVYVWDDHDFGPGDSDGTYAHKATPAQVYRERVPHYPLAVSDGVYHSFTIGRVRFVVTDQRYFASVKSATDNSSKTMLGATQKTWFKAEISAAATAGQMVVWVCSRTFGAVASAGHDSWGGFTTERTELADYIKANAHGRVVVLSADRHALDIDDGTHSDFATGGGEPIPTFQAAPLDRTDAKTYGGATYSHPGGSGDHQYGTVQVTDTGGSTIGVTWRGFNGAGTQLVSYSFSVTI